MTPAFNSISELQIQNHFRLVLLAICAYKWRQIAKLHVPSSQHTTSQRWFLCPVVSERCVDPKTSERLQSPRIGLTLELCLIFVCAKAPSEVARATAASRFLCHWLIHGTPPRRSYQGRQLAAKMKEIGLEPSKTGDPGGKETGQSVT
jgi:hypothetical protein